MSDLRERLAEALESDMPPVEDMAALWVQGKRTAAQLAERILAADPALARAAEFGLAWEAAEAALPSGWMLEVVRSGVIAGDINPHTGYPVEWPPTRYFAVAQPAWEGALDTEYRATGPTPTAALLSLAARLKGSDGA